MDESAAPRIGTDLVDVPRFSRALRRREGAWQARVFTEAEWTHASGRPDRDTALAVRFAAKEAAMKALRTGWGRGVRWLDIEVQGGGRSAPRMLLHGVAADLAKRAGLHFDVSLTHAGDVASATVLAWPVGAQR